MEKIEEWSRKNSIKRIELTVVAHNNIAINLYKKSGFHIEGIKRSSFKIKDKFYDQYYMAKIY